MSFIANSPKFDTRGRFVHCAARPRLVTLAKRKDRVDRSDRIGHVEVDGFKVDRLVPRLRTPVWGQ
ncbi:hypothetical protein ASG20_12310 [Sphingomonas sp. Leaf198]|nr:hypothetical protein ASG20_12310 [Sphingomonas sp. Leaf198]